MEVSSPMASSSGSDIAASTRKTDVNISHIEKALSRPMGYTEEEASFMDSFDDARKKKVLRKIDIRLVPVLAVLYLMSYVDRANIGNAQIEGLSKTLNMDDNQYNIAKSVFLLPISLLVPSNIVLKKVRPSYWMAFLTISWSVVMTLTGVVQNWGALVACRFFLGVTEAGFFPGAILIVSSWYLTNEVGQRIALFYSASALAGAFSGLLAFAIAKMDGLGGYEGWRWIFIIEGLASLALGIAVPFILIDNPKTSKWLSDDEKRFLQLRMQAHDSGAAIQAKGDKLTWKVFRSVLLDKNLYMIAVMYFANVAGNFGLTFTMSQIIKNMGFTSSNAQLLTIPPYCVGAVRAYTTSRIADHFRGRMPFIVGGFTLIIVSFAILFSYSADKHIGACYFALILSCIGFFPISPAANSWTSNNLSGPMKRAAGIGFMLTIGNSGGVVGGFIYVGREKPSYPTGLGPLLGWRR